MTVPFQNAEEAWFWFMDCEKARADGARIVAGMGLYERPCVPADIYKVAVNLRQTGELTPGHMMTLIHILQSQPPAPDIVPGMMYCAKCNFSLTRNNLYVKNGTMGPGDNKTEPCPNGCGPLWPYTWKQLCGDYEQRLMKELEEKERCKVVPIEGLKEALGEFAQPECDKVTVLSQKISFEGFFTVLDAANRYLQMQGDKDAA